MPELSPHFRGVVILDTPCYDELRSPDVRAALKRSLSAADLRVWPSIVNAVQARNHPSSGKRRALLEAINDLAERLPLLPLPEAILHQAAAAVAAGLSDIPIQPAIDQSLLFPDLQLPDTLEGLSPGLAQIDQIQDDALDRMRPEVRGLIRRAEGGLPWATLPRFLDEQWMTEEQFVDILRAESERFGLERPLTLSEITSTPALRLHFEGFGAAMYQRVLAANQAKRVQASDLMQLVYLGARSKRILVTKDRSFRELAHAVLVHRYPTARVLDWETFADLNYL
jgi:hypothetical protein